jgi:hypothetical protein
LLVAFGLSALLLSPLALHLDLPSWDLLPTLATP